MRRASGEACAAASAREVRGAGGITVWPGRNFSVAGFGVDSVWMNMGGLRMRVAP